MNITSSELMIIVGSVILLIFAFLIFANYSKNTFRRQFAEELDKILEDLNSKKTEPSFAVIKADALFDKFLTNYGKATKSNNLGKKLISFQKKFSKERYNKLWRYHKLRNKIVHENYSCSAKEAKNAILAFSEGITYF